MKIFKNKLNLQKEISKENLISFVPNMGGLHKGHLNLIKKAKKYKCKICVSIFVNLNQFDNKSEYLKYPRNLRSDIMELKKLKINYLYLPSYEDIYSFKVKNKIYLNEFSKHLCGKFRKGHFEGVLNVVNRFLEIIKPKYIFLGQKDLQQLILIDHHILKNSIKCKVIRCKTIREKNGVACSTRNLNLDNYELMIAANIYKYLFNLSKKIKKNYKSFKINTIKKDLFSIGVTKIDYIKNLNIKNFYKKRKLKNKFRLFIAYYINNVRLIDNI